MNLFSLEFIILLSTLFIVYYLIPGKWQWTCLLVASIVFYAFSGAENMIFIGSTSFTTWYAGILMAKLVQQFNRDKKAKLVSNMSYHEIGNVQRLISKFS